MSRRSLAIALALPFSLVTLLALKEGGLTGFVRHHQSWGGIQVFADLVIMALLACVWMAREARCRRTRVWPWVVMTLALGSFGPLSYLAVVPPGPADDDRPAGTVSPAPPPRGAAALIALTITLFGGLTAKALAVHGYFGIWRLQFASLASLQVLADLGVLGLLGCLWMVADARRHGNRPWPYLLLTLAAGSFGPLAYLLVRTVTSPASRLRRPRLAARSEADAKGSHAP